MTPKREKNNFPLFLVASGGCGILIPKTTIKPGPSAVKAESFVVVVVVVAVVPAFFSFFHLFLLVGG